ncbi:hypothetical protein [Aureispira anguillae]|uniref:Uncharacterized protein n=1 Tax=Aureispira anguillae TaxID=2864201 RepID=A0A916DVX0_9BACT|nr:hypothetical protein [Aureispira anguillae]BDS14035.1 hypothetical protein AsAng_0047980 [Aureispira anguillae]
MTLKFTLTVIFLSLAILCINIPVSGQMCTGKNKSPHNEESMVTQTAIAQNVPTKRIYIPPNYTPPLADKKLIMFPETVATKKKQKKLLKKRKKQKKANRQGCIAINM